MRGFQHGLGSAVLGLHSTQDQGAQLAVGWRDGIGHLGTEDG